MRKLQLVVLLVVQFSVFVFVDAAVYLGEDVCVSFLVPIRQSWGVILSEGCPSMEEQPRESCSSLEELPRERRPSLEEFLRGRCPSSEELSLGRVV